MCYQSIEKKRDKNKNKYQNLAHSKIISMCSFHLPHCMRWNVGRIQNADEIFARNVRMAFVIFQ